MIWRVSNIILVILFHVSFFLNSILAANGSSFVSNGLSLTKLKSLEAASPGIHDSRLKVLFVGFAPIRDASTLLECPMTACLPVPDGPLT
jgi:hypothetical protein